jgi:hypothetical protein
MMGDVYARAIEVLIWLGSEDEYEDTRKAMAYKDMFWKPRVDDANLNRGWDSVRETGD